jgi:hypothetical protein
MNSCFSMMNNLVDFWGDNALNCMKYNPVAMTLSFWTDGAAEKLYKNWKTEVHDSMMRLYSTPGFAASSWEMQKSMAGPWKLFVSMAEQSMKAMDLPTAEDFEELTLRCDYLEDRLKELNQINCSDSREERSPSPAKISMETSELPVKDSKSQKEPEEAEPAKRKKRRK